MKTQELLSYYRDLKEGDSKLDKEELLEYLEIWKDAFKRAVKKSKLMSMMNKEIKEIELKRIERAYKQIRKVILK